MAFAGIGAVAPKGLNWMYGISKGFHTMVNSMKKADKAIKKQQKRFEPYGKAISSFFKVMGDSLSNIATFGFDALGILLQLADSMGLLEPIINLLTGVLTLMGGEAFKLLGPSIKTLAEFLFSSKMIKFWKDLGIVIGEFMSYMINNVIAMLKDPSIRKLILNAVKAIGKILLHLGKIFMIFAKIFAGLDVSILGKAIWVLAVAIAFFKGLSAGGLFGAIVGAAMATAVGIALAPLLALQTGGYVGPTRGGTHIIVGEGGEGEFIVPESKIDTVSNNEEVVWAVEELGNKMDMTNRLLRSGKRLR